MAILAAVIVVIVFAGINARGSYLKRALTDKESRDLVTGPAVFEVETYGNMSIKMAQGDSFNNKAKMKTHGMDVWELVTARNGLSGQYREVIIPAGTNLNVEQEAMRLAKSVWASNPMVKEVDHSVYTKNGKTVFEGNYILDLYERRLFVCVEKKENRSLALIVLAWNYAEAIQDSMVNNVIFR
jgi:hypothetical protein